MIWSWPRAARQRQSTELREALRTAAALSAALWGSAIPELLGMDYTGIQESLAERAFRYSGSPAPDLSPHQWRTWPCGIGHLEAPEGGQPEDLYSGLFRSQQLGSRQPLRLGAGGLTTRGIRSVSGGVKVLGAESSGLRRP